MGQRASTNTHAAPVQCAWLAGVMARLRSALAAASAQVNRSSLAPPSEIKPWSGASHHQPYAQFWVWTLT